MIFSFGEFELDLRLSVLRRGGETVRLQPKVFDTVRYLIEHRDRVVSKAELLSAVWNGQRLSGVTVPWSIRQARRALGQQSVEGPPIETVRGRGYRFAADVSTQPAAGVTVAPTEAHDSGTRRGGSIRPSAEPFLGREGPMDRLSGALAEARAGRGSFWILVGESGIGKTRCANELAAVAREAGVEVSIGRSSATEGAPPFWPWTQALREASEDHQLTREERAALLSVLGRLTPQSVSAAVGRAGAAAGLDASRFWLCEAAARAARQVTRRRPRVIIIEDLQAADEGSIDVLALLAPELAQSHLLVIATSRDDVGGRFSRRLRPCEVLGLDGLGLAEVQQYLSGAIGVEAAPDLARFVHDRTAGNPLFVKEAARMVLAQGARRGSVGAGSVALPEVARGFLHDRIANLGAKAREALDAASVIGERFELAVLGRALGWPPEVLLSCMDDALGARIVEKQVGEEYAFAHALLRDALYEDLSHQQRRRLHQKVAAALQARAAVEPRHRAIAFHLHHALPDADPAQVEHSSRLAGDAAMQVFAYADAAELYRWAIAAQGHDSDPDVRAACELMMSAAYAERQAGRVPEARERCARAIELARANGYGDLLVLAARSLRPTVWLAPVPDKLVLDALEHALEILPGGASTARSQAYGLLANIPPHSASLERSRDLSARAVEMAREIGDRSLVLEALVRTFHSLTGPDTTDELLAAADEVLRLDGPPLSWWSAEAFLARHHALAQRCDSAGAARALEAFGESARLLRISEAVWQYDRLRAQRAINAGEFAVAEASFADLFARSEGFRQYAAFHYAAQMNALSWARTGKPLPMTAVLGSSADVAWQWAASIPAFRGERALMLLSSGETIAAGAELDDLARDGFQFVTRDMGYLYTLCRLAEVAAGLGRTETAQELYDRLLPYAGYDAINAMSLGIGSVAHYLGVLARFLGRSADAKAHFEQAVATNARLGDRVHEARSRAALEETSSAARGAAPAP
jgi:DNA-binding winged helix-turn-helix (wHTH) protein/tetratricopeptide (TPR) repeat protein